MCEGKCDSNCDGSCGDGKDKKRVVEMSAESMASMPLDMREEIERIVKVLPDGMRIRVVRSNEITDELKKEMKEKGVIGSIMLGMDKAEDKRTVEDMAKESAMLLNKGDEETRKESRKVLAKHILETLCDIGVGLEALEDAGIKPLMCVRPGKKGIDGKESKVNTLLGCGEWSVNSMLKLVAKGLMDNEIRQK